MTAGLKMDKICGVKGDFNNHITSIIADDNFWICVEVEHEHVCFGDCVGHGRGLFRGYLVEGRNNAGVTGAAIV